MGAWLEFVTAMTFLSNPKLYTLPLWINLSITNPFGIPWAKFAAASLISRILRVILNFFPQTLYIYRKGIVVYIFTGNVPDFLQQPASGQNSSLIV